MELFPLLVTLAGMGMSFAYYPQAYKIVKKKSVKSVSLTTYMLFFPGSFIWLLYGISLMDWPMIISNAMGFLGCTIVLIVYFMYRKK